jgi:hypothetical protein
LENSASAAAGDAGPRGLAFRLPYLPLCIGLGMVLAWIPWLLHGPIAYKFDIYRLNGGVMVWAFYSARMLIGFWVGATTWPAKWWVRGPVCGFLSLLPVACVALATPGCGFT